MVDVVRRVTVQGRSEGLDKVASDLGSVATAQKAVASASQTTATVTDMSSRRHLSSGQALDRLRASLDTTVRAQQQFGRGQDIVNRSFEQGRIDIAEQARLLGLLEQRYNAVASSAARAASAQVAARPRADMIGGMSAVGAPHLANLQASQAMIAGMSGQMGKLGQTTKLTSFEMNNLGFQINDIAVMAASGQSPFVLIMQQGMQIAQIMAMSSVATAGLGATLRAIGEGVKSFLTSPLNLAVAATAAVAGGIWLLARSFGSAIPPLEDALKRHEEVLNRIRDAYRDVGIEVREMGDESIRVLQFLQRTRTDDVQKNLAEVAEDIQSRLGSRLAAIQTGRLQEFELLQPAVEALTASQNILEFRDALVSLRKENPTNDFLQELTRRMLDLTDQTAKAQQELREFGGLPALGSFRAAQQGGIPAGGFANDHESMFMLRQQQALDIEALSARSPAQQAAIAMERERLDLIGQRITTEERAERIAMAGTLARVQAEHEITEATRERMLAMADNAGAAQLDIDLIGKTAGETARLRTEFELWREAKEAARQVGGVVSQAEIDAINAASDAAGRGADQYARFALAHDLAFERGQLGRGPMDRDVASRLQGAGLAVDLDSAEASAIRYNLQLERSIDLMDEMRGMSRSFIQGFLKGIREGDIEGAFENLFENILGRLEQSIASQMTDALFGPQGALGSGPLGGFIQNLFGIKAPPGLDIGERGATPLNPMFVSVVGGAGIGEGIAGLLGLGAAPGSFRAAQEAGMADLITERILEALPGPAPHRQGTLGVASDRLSEWFPARNVPRLPGTMGVGGDWVGGNALLDLIARAEGTIGAGRRGYNETLDYGRWTGGDQNLVGMTINQIRELQRGMLTPENQALYPGGGSSALGRYQITGRTLGGLQERFGLSGEELFDPAMQDRMALELARARGNDITGLRNEWRGLQGVPADEINAAFQGGMMELPEAVAQIETAFTDAAAKTSQIGMEFASDFDAGLTGLASATGQVGQGFIGDLGSQLSNIVEGIGGQGGGGGGLFGWLSGLFGGGGGGGYVPPELGYGAGALTLGGGFGTPAPAPRPDFSVGPRPAASSSRPPPLVVNITNNNGSQVTTKEADNGQGGRRLDVQIDEGVANAIARPGSKAGRATKTRFGAQEQLVRR